MNLNLEPYRRRRQRLLEDIGEGIALLFAAPERPRNRDILYPYRFDRFLVSHRLPRTGSRARAYRRQRAAHPAVLPGQR